MRPKIVILILLGAFVGLGVIAVVKGARDKKTDADNNPGTAVQASDNPGVPPDTNQAAGLAPASTAASEQMRATLLQKELEDVLDLEGQADGTNNQMIIAALVQKLSSPEHEVRQAVLDALKQLNDTNAVAPLQAAVQNIQDPREKVAVLDAIDYIKMPSATENVPADLTTNVEELHVGPFTNRPANAPFNSKFVRANPNIQVNGGSPAPPADPPAGVPQ